MNRALLAACLALVSCKGCKKSPEERAREEHGEEHEDRDDKPDEHDDDEQEDEDQNRDNFWRARITIVGQGTVRTVSGAFDCTSDGAKQSGECGPKLLLFKERQPPLLRATGSAGWRLEHWESNTREPSGVMRARKGPMPDGRLYINGFGYSDTGELETVTAVFVRAEDGNDDLHAATPR